MRKIPTLFMRDPDDMSRLLPEVNPTAAWVIDGEGYASRKYDGTCVRICDGTEGGLGGWWARREVKKGKQPPEDFWPEETDPNTGKTVGWEPIGQTGFLKYLREAVDHHPIYPPPGTYELCGPKINGNPEGFARHGLVRHGEDVLEDTPLSFEGLRGYLAEFRGEGIVWHHEDGRMAKLKRRDFR